MPLAMTPDRVLMECRPSDPDIRTGQLDPRVGPGGCGRLWATPATYRTYSCPRCKGNNTRAVGRIVARKGKGRCTADCKLSESRRCSCSCGGVNHGEALIVTP